MKSLHVIKSTARRGAETFAVDLAARLCEEGDEAHVVALIDSRDDEPHAVPVLGASRRDPRGLTALRRAARGVDVTVAHGSATLESCALALTGTGTPFVYRTIGDPSYWTTTGARRRWVNALLHRATRHVALWSGAATDLARLAGLRSSRIDVIANGAPSERFPLRETTQREQARASLGIATARAVGYVGALSPEKNVVAVLEVAARHPDLTVLIVGNGPQRERLEQMSRRRSLRNVRWLGARADVGQVYRALDLLLLPSLSEGMPAVVIEAGLTGVPTLASPVGGLPDMLATDRQLGYLADARDVEAYAAEVPAALSAASSTGRVAAEEFRVRYDMRHIAGAWRDTLERTAEAAR